MSETTSDFKKDVQIDLVLPNIKANHKVHAYQIITEALSPYISCSPTLILERLIKHEDHNVSTIGDGIDLPHLKANFIQKPFTILATLKKPTDFKAADYKAVDIICLTLSPEKEKLTHLRRLSRISRLLKHPDIQEKIRQTSDIEAIQSLMAEPEGYLLAA